MKKNIVSILSVLLLVAICIFHIPVVQAQTTTAVTSSLEAATVPEEIVPETVQRENNGEITKARKTRAVNLSANISNRFDAEALRLETITLRLQSRIQKMEESGYDVLQAEIQLAEAQKNSTEIKASVRDIDTEVLQAISSEKPREAWIRVRTIFIHIHELLVATKQTLQETLILLKESEQKGIARSSVASSTVITEPSAHIDQNQ